MNFYALDIETSSSDAEHPEYALQPWRPEFRVDLIMGLGVAGSKAMSLIESEINIAFDGQYVFGWNIVFDIAGLLSQGIDCSKVKWLDAMSAAKWVLRSQKTDTPEGSRYSWSLANAAKDHLKDWEHYAEFMDVKDHYVTAGEDPDYWRRRCELDVEATLRLGALFWDQMTPQQRRAFIIEQEALYPTALAWMNGCHYDFAAAEAMRGELEEKQRQLLKAIEDAIPYTGIYTHMIIASPKQLAELVYDTWGVPFDESHCRSDKGGRSVGKEALTFLIEDYGSTYPQLLLIKQYREILTKMSKFVAGPEKAREYLGSEIMRHNWRLNSTYTGRCTVSSKVRQ